MKTAIVCDWLVSMGGAERFLGHLLRCYPEADLFAIIDFIPSHERNFLLGKSTKTSFIQKIPLAKKRYRNYLPLMPMAVEQLDVSDYELIISSSHAVAKGVLTGPDQLHISYVHSPMRYAWDLQQQYLKYAGLGGRLNGWIARYLLHKIRLWDVRTANGVDYFVANSRYIARRIEKVYRRQADVIYPPIDLSQFKVQANKENFYFTASRLVPYKRIDLIVESFNTMPDKTLIVIGDGPDYAKIKRKCGKNVKMLGFQSNEVLLEHLQRAKAFLFAAEEDFGLLPLEAQACGTPVIAYGKGGALETVIGIDQAKPTGLFFHEQSVDAICDAVKRFENYEPGFNFQDCAANAARFSPVQFEFIFKNFVQNKLEGFKKASS